MSAKLHATTSDVAIIGGGPAGLSAAMLLGRCRREVVVFDHGKPRNLDAQAIHGYLGLDGIAPDQLRERGRTQAMAYGVRIIDMEVTSVERIPETDDSFYRFDIRTREGSFVARKLLFATGVVDILPKIDGIRDFYGQTVHHCPYCDGWEHRDRRLVAIGKAHNAVKLARLLRIWSSRVTTCSNGQELNEADRERLHSLGIDYREAKIKRLTGADGVLQTIEFHHGEPLQCDALFFSSDQSQRSSLPESLGCNSDEKGLIATSYRQASGRDGIFLAGDACGDVQFAIVAAAEGAIAATAINQELQAEDQR